MFWCNCDVYFDSRKKEKCQERVAGICSAHSRGKMESKQKGWAVGGVP